MADNKHSQTYGMADLFATSPTAKKNIDFATVQTGEESPLRDRCFVIVGKFGYDRAEIKKALIMMGGEEKNQVSKNSHFVLLGAEAPEDQLANLRKLRKNGFMLRIIQGDEELEELLYVGGQKFMVSKEIRKELDFTWHHYNEHTVDLSGTQNTIAGKELYFGADLAGKGDYFYQMCGNLGSFGNWDLNPAVQICVLSDATLAQLKQGKKDETIRDIETYYNNTPAITFEFRFISEAAILDFCRRRLETCGDEVMRRLLQAYNNH